VSQNDQQRYPAKPGSWQNILRKQLIIVHDYIDRSLSVAVRVAVHLSNQEQKRRRQQLCDNQLLPARTVQRGTVHHDGTAHGKLRSSLAFYHHAQPE